MYGEIGAGKTALVRLTAEALGVIEKVTRNVVLKDGDKESMFIGIKCRWFDANNVLREAVFSTKDLVHVN